MSGRGASSSRWVLCGAGETSKGIKNLGISRCGVHLFNGIKIGRQTEHERHFQEPFDLWTERLGFISVNSLISLKEFRAIAKQNFTCIAPHAAFYNKTVSAINREDDKVSFISRSPLFPSQWKCSPFSSSFHFWPVATPSTLHTHPDRNGLYRQHISPSMMVTSRTMHRSTTTTTFLKTTVVILVI